MKTIPNLSPAQYERLALIAEEAGEIVQAIGKILRHGYESTHPTGGPTNRHLLEIEIGDLGCAIDLSVGAGDLSEEAIAAACFSKEARVGKYLHHQTPNPDRHPNQRNA